VSAIDDLRREVLIYPLHDLVRAIEVTRTLMMGRVEEALTLGYSAGVDVARREVVAQFWRSALVAGLDPDVVTAIAAELESVRVSQFEEGK
jgi:hypothetical protein